MAAAAGDELICQSQLHSGVVFFNYSARLHENELMQQQQRLLYLKTQSNTEIQTKKHLPQPPTLPFTQSACH